LIGMAGLTILDAKGLRCPLPVLKARRAMKDLPVGATLRVLATDPGAIKDFEAFCKTTGHRLLSASQSSDLLTFDIEKTA
jgi:tRNA 2-thiouridine synthesizing protein A